MFCVVFNCEFVCCLRAVRDISDARAFNTVLFIFLMVLEFRHWIKLQVFCRSSVVYSTSSCCRKLIVLPIAICLFHLVKLQYRKRVSFPKKAYFWRVDDTGLKAWFGPVQSLLIVQVSSMDHYGTGLVATLQTRNLSLNNLNSVYDIHSPTESNPQSLYFNQSSPDVVMQVCFFPFSLHIYPG